MIRLPRESLAVIAVLAISACASARTAVAAPARPSVGDLSRSLQAIAERVHGAVVHIDVTGVQVAPFAGDTGDLITATRATGSGVIVDPSGYVVTNHHVVSAARRVRVIVQETADGSPGRSILKARTRAYDATVVGTDAETDIAVLKIAGDGDIDFPYLRLGDSDGVARGEIVLAFGGPFGLENSVSMGVVSATARQLQPDHPMVYIQTDASVNPGNSGGPLVDSAGTVIGITSFILSKSGGSEGLSFAVPSNIVAHVTNQIRRHGRVRRGVIGIEAQSLTPDIARGLGLSEQWGVVVADVYPGSPAALAGLRVGDVIHSLDGKPMENARQFDVNLYRRTVGDLVRLRIGRGTQQISAAVPIAERPPDPANLAALLDRETNLVPELGILALSITTQLATMRLPFRAKHGVLVAGVSADAAASSVRLRPGDLIHAVNGEMVSSLDDLRAALTGGVVVLHVERQRTNTFVAAQLRPPN